MKKMKIIVGLLTVFCACILITACSGENKLDTGSEKLNMIKIGNQLPNISVRNLGLGDLKKAESSNVDFESDNKADGYERYAVEYYKGVDDDTELHVAHYKNPKKDSLEKFTLAKTRYSDGDQTNYRMGKSEIYSLMNKDVDDGYFVKIAADKDKAYWIAQQATYADGDNEFVILCYLYKCADQQIGDTNVTLSIPNINDAKVEDGVYGNSSKRFSYDDKAELPTITYYITNKSLDDALKNYALSYNANTQKTVIDNHEVGIAKETDATINGTKYNQVTMFIPTSNGKLAAVELRERADAQTYAFAAVSYGIKVS